MTRMKDSGIEWIGEVPEEWGLKPIKYLVSTPVTDGPHETPTLYDDGIPFLSAESVKNGILDSRYKRGYISETAHKIFSRKVSPQKNDIFIVKSGATTGNVGIVTTDEIFDIWSPLALVRTRSDLANQKFIYYFMLSDAFTKQIQNKWSFGTQQNIGMGVIEKIKLVVPPLDEQTQITNFLDKKVAQLDSVKSLLEEQVKTLEDYRQSLIYETVTKGLDKTVPLKDSGVDWIGQIPEGWNVDRLGFHIYEINEKNIPQKSDFILSLTNKDGVIPYEDKGNQGNNSKDNLLDYKLAYPDTIVANSMNILIGSVGYSNYFGCISPVYYVFKERLGTNLKFVNYIMATQLFQKELRKYANGILEIRLRVSSEDILKRFCAFPSLSDQDKIVSYLDKRTNQINQMIAIKKEQIENINKQRQTLIYDYVTGKRRV
ncbi:restriction endonuclease subunit S [Streptococcus suis]|uniref:Type I restriction modification DNA specificity protein n=2 Tax=Streptococcus suis TaxID=1307 RepID=A0A123T743_STRSU|nr:restriction endonuclease subunit S [Streptococcus suis]AGL47194.1 Type I restriction-modification system, specificity subunit S [Streptococcus suis TL13]NQH23556.1 restriction endonuclease subunit S [Streptococcus suis]NQH64474.1 restriction endonuclease subunit S [Streptococcus suis]NQI18071.1 restriction endonuclease subunit S [Streptococcus suis]NQP21241.1 restriction endonuclease subunit S [Streptococcus suis]